MNYRDEQITHFRGIPLKEMSREDLITALQLTLKSLQERRGPRSERASY